MAGRWLRSYRELRSGVVSIYKMDDSFIFTRGRAGSGRLPGMWLNRFVGRGRVVVAMGLVGLFVGVGPGTASATWFSTAGPVAGSAISTAALQTASGTSGSGNTGGWDEQPVGAFQGQGVSCPSTSMCWAVGTLSGDYGEVAQWTSAGGWGAASTVPGTGNLYSVSCPSTSMCVAGGYGGADQWTSSNGWGAVANAPGAGVYLYGASCPSTSMCVVVGKDGVDGYAAVYTPPSISLSWTAPASPTTDYDGNPLYPTIAIGRTTTTSSTCPTSGYSALATLSGATTSYSDTAVSTGTSYCYSLTYSDQNWTSSTALVGPVAP